MDGSSESEAIEGWQSLRLMSEVMEYWPALISLVGLIIVLAKMHANQEVMKEKIAVLFDLWNRRDKD